MNTLYYGDNLPVLRHHIKDETVDLVYLDPPFKSDRQYNILFKEQDGSRAAAQIEAFEDTWRWDQAAAAAYEEIVVKGGRVSQVMQAFRAFLDESDMLAYLSMMAPRLVELRRILKPTGSIYLHCDPAASHYLKILMDAVFGPKNFRNHITWQRSDTHNDAVKQFSAVSDHILFYGMSDQITFHRLHSPYPDKTLKNWYLWIELPDGTVRRMTTVERETQVIPNGARRFNTDNLASPNPRPNLMYDYKGYPHPPKGWRCDLKRMKMLDSKGLLLFPGDKTGRIMFKRYLDEQKGVTVGDIWTDIDQLRASMAERLGYPTQKPEALMDRIIQASSNEGDLVLDPFCGCGTTVASAQRLKRRWIGIDITYLAIGLIRRRLWDAYGDQVVSTYKVIGEPVSLPDAEALASQDPYQFQWWALDLVGARPADQKKGADKGIDGRLFFFDEAQGAKSKQIILSVKAGHTMRAHVIELRGVIEREKADIGVLISLQEPTQPMREEAASAGFYDSPGWGKKYPRLQLLTIAELLAGKEIEYPPHAQVNVTFKRAPKSLGKESDQLGLAAEEEPSYPAKRNRRG